MENLSKHFKNVLIIFSVKLVKLSYEWGITSLGGWIFGYLLK